MDSDGEKTIAGYCSVVACCCFISYTSHNISNKPIRSSHKVAAEDSHVTSRHTYTKAVLSNCQHLPTYTTHYSPFILDKIPHSWSQIHIPNQSPGWWFNTFFIFHHIWDNPFHWLSYFSRWLLHHQPVSHFKNQVPDMDELGHFLVDTKRHLHIFGKSMLS